MKLSNAALSIILGATSFCQTSVRAEEFKHFYIGAGLINHNVGEAITNATTATRPFFNEQYPQVSLAVALSLGTDWLISPDFHYALPAKTTPEGYEKTSVYSYGLRVVYRISDLFDLHFGPSVLVYKISGAGGIIPLSNGASTSNFGIPSTSSSSNSVCLDTGVGFGQAYRAELDLLISGVAKTARRAYSPLLTLSMGL